MNEDVKELIEELNTKKVLFKSILDFDSESFDIYINNKKVRLLEFLKFESSNWGKVWDWAKRETGLLALVDLTWPYLEERIILEYLYSIEDKDFLEYHKLIVDLRALPYGLVHTLSLESPATNGDFLKLKLLVKDDYIRSINMEESNEQIERYNELENEIKLLKEYFHNSEFDKCRKQLYVVNSKLSHIENRTHSNFEK